MNVAIYLRKSRADENNPQQTLTRHKEILLEYAKENNLTVLDIFEEVISGGLLCNRSEMLKLLDNVPMHIYDAVLCVDIDRLSRGSAADSEKIFHTLKYNNVKIITLKKVYDLNNEYDEDYSEFEMFMARKELKFITRRMYRGRVKSLNEGCFIAAAPFGYRNAIINKKHTLEIYEPEAKFVRMIFDMYVNQNMGITAIARHLEILGVLGKKNVPIQPSTVSRMLKNYTYIGRIVWNKSKSVKDKKTQIKTDVKDWISVPGLHNAIIDEDTFFKAQEIIHNRYSPPTDIKELKNPLAGLLKCANCGKTMVINPSNATVERYRLCCRTPHCNKSSPLSLTENTIIETLLNEFDTLEMICNVSDSNISEKQSLLNTISLLETELAKFNKQLLRLYDLLEQGVYSKEIFLERNITITNKISKINENLTVRHNQLQNINMPSCEKQPPLLSELLHNYNSLAAVEKNSLLKCFIEKIEYKREKSDSQGNIFLKIYYK